MTSAKITPSWASILKPALVEATISSRENNYNLIRFFLAASVIYYHAFVFVGNGAYPDYLSAAMPQEMSVGRAAVDSFFFLSGIFVSQSFYKDQSRVNFIIKRFFRIWPGLFICLFITSLGACVASHPYDAFPYLTYPEVYRYILNNAVFRLTWTIPGVFDGRANAAINGSIHTLPTEIKMYFLLLCASMLALNRSKLSIFFAGAVILYIILWHLDFICEVLSIPRDIDLAMIMFFCGVMVFALAAFISPHLWIGATCIFLAFLTRGAWQMGFVLGSFAWLTLFFGQLSFFWRPKSDLSYGIYIYGWPSEQFVATLFPHTTPYVLTILALGLSYIFADLSWRIVERPGIAFGHSLAGRWSTFCRRGQDVVPQLSANVLRGRLQMAGVGSLLVICLLMVWVSSTFAMKPEHPLGVKITAFEPMAIKQGTGFNVQPSGLSAIWLAVDRQAPDGTNIIFDGHRLVTSVGQTSISALVPAFLLTKAGKKKILLELRLPNYTEHSNSVSLDVLPR